MQTVMFGLFAVKGVSIPIFLTFRRCGCLATITVQYFVEGKYPSSKTAWSTLIVILGAIIGGYETLDTELFGYMLVWGNNFTQSIYNVVMSKLNSDKRITPFEINFFFALIGIPISACLVYNEGEIMTLYDVLLNPTTRNPNLATLVLLSGFSGILITLSSILTVTICGPIAINIAGIIKDVGLSYIGFAFFDDAKATPLVLTGLAFSFTGAISMAFENIFKS